MTWLVMTLALAADPAVRLDRGQEWLARGVHTFLPAGGSPVRTGVEARAFVLESSPAGSRLAMALELKGDAATSVRLVSVVVGPRGEPLAVDAAEPHAPPRGDPGFVLELPPTPLAPGVVWDTMPPGGPPVGWRVEGEETRRAGRCFVARGEQQSAAWDRPDGDGRAWRSEETVWLHALTGLVVRRERVVRFRGKSAGEARLQIDVEGPTVYPERLQSERRAEIDLALRLLADERPARNRARYHIDHAPATPYRDALLAALDRPAPLVRVVADAPRLAVGEPLADFAAPALDTGRAVRLARLRGKPVALVMFRPESPLSADALGVLAGVAERHGGSVGCVAVAVGVAPTMAGGTPRRWPFPVVAGGVAGPAVGPDVTPRLVLLDAAGVVRVCVDGWGAEWPKLVSRVLGE